MTLLQFRTITFIPDARNKRHFIRMRDHYVVRKCILHSGAKSQILPVGRQGSPMALSETLRSSRLRGENQTSNSEFFFEINRRTFRYP